jgi:hypothetical protein
MPALTQIDPTVTARALWLAMHPLPTRADGSKSATSPIDPPPLKWPDLRYVFDSQEGHDGKEALQG